jgi:hypothetical protein
MQRLVGQRRVVEPGQRIGTADGSLRAGHSRELAQCLPEFGQGGGLVERADAGQQGIRALEPGRADRLLIVRFPVIKGGERLRGQLIADPALGMAEADECPQDVGHLPQQGGVGHDLPGDPIGQHDLDDSHRPRYGSRRLDCHSRPSRRVAPSSAAVGSYAGPN